MSEKLNYELCDEVAELGPRENPYSFPRKETKGHTENFVSTDLTAAASSYNFSKLSSLANAADAMIVVGAWVIIKHITTCNRE